MCFLIFQFVSFSGSHIHNIHTKTYTHAQYIPTYIYINIYIFNQIHTVHFTKTHIPLTLIEYGRSCKDIGCRPSETCVISHDSCSWSQQDGKECGSYPTCKRSSNTNSSPGKLTTHLNIAMHAKFDFLIVCVCFVSISSK